MNYQICELRSFQIYQTSNEHTALFFFNFACQIILIVLVALHALNSLISEENILTN